MENNVINYGGKIKPYDIQKKPSKQWGLFKWLIYVVSKLALGGKHTIEKIGMENLKAPYVVLSNHMAFEDLELNAMANYPYRVNNIATFETFHKRAWLLEKCGCVGKRKFTTDPSLLNACETILNDYKSVLTIYPEARYSPWGTTSYIPPSYAALVKRLGKPVCIMVHHGNYLSSPFWDWRRHRKIKHYSTLKLVLDENQLKELTTDEIYKIIVNELQYDEYKYQKENGIIIDEPYRAEGLHKVLYQCPACGKEHEMSSSGAILKCEACSKEWELTVTGELLAKDGNTEFARVPDWAEWQRANVKAEIENGKYFFEDTVDVYSLPNPSGFIPLGKARLTHGPKQGFIVEGEYNGEKYRISRPSVGMYAVHIEYDYCYIRPEECIQISTLNDTFVCYPTKKNAVTKISLATEEMYFAEQRAKEARKALKNQA